MRYPSTTGIAVGPILFILAILAVLAVAIASSNSTSTTNTTSEKARITAATMISYSLAIKDTVTRLVSQGCDPATLDFTNGVWKDYQGNEAQAPNALAVAGCQVFNGSTAFPGRMGMMNAQLFEGAKTLFTDCCVAPGHIAFDVGRVEGIGSSMASIFMYIRDIDSAVCKAINLQLYGTAAYPDANSYTADVYNGSFTGSYTPLSGTGLTGKMQSCSHWPGAQENDNQFITLIHVN